MTSLLLFIGLSALTSTAVYGHDSVAFTFELPDNERQCFYSKYKESKKMTFEYEVIRGGNTDVDAMIESPNGQIVYAEQKMREDQVDFESSYGVYSFCFSNEFSTFSHKVVYFELRPEGHESLSDIAGHKKPTANTQIEETMDHIHRSSQFVQQMQKNYRLLEARGRHIAEDLSTRVQVWSLGEALVIMFMGLGQVLVLRKFFTHIRPSTKEPKHIALPTQTLRP